MERFELYIFTALCSLNFLTSCLMFSRINQEQRDPYMDEMFHVPQAQKYCEGRFNEWDHMITTLPGLYLASVGLIKPVVWLSDVKMLCSTAMLRSINLLFNSGTLYIMYLLICRMHPKEKTHSAARRMLSSLTLSTFPVLYFFTFLYYTDAGSTFFTLFMYLMTLYGSYKTSALLGICAILFRQTNIIWVAFCAGTVVAQKLDESWRTEQSKKQDDKPLYQVPLTIGGAQRVIRFLLDFVKSASNLKSVVSSTWPYMTIAAGFVVFIVLNNGIVVGDRSSHEACLNFPQVFYFLSFTLIFSLPSSLSYQRVVGFFQALRKKPLTYFVLMTIFLVLVWKFTVVHKYLLADNRHYPFYVWKRIFQRHDFVRLLLVPGYVFAMWNFMDTLKHKSLFWHLVFCICLVLATVPQKLLEFRYFILPYLLYRIHVPLPSLPRLWLEFGLYTTVNAATLYIFLYKTFLWPDSTETQRFMW